MPKNILIFSDGTGQIGGMRPDQRLSNIYKMYRAMRSGPDSPISPEQQVAFYDPGLGSGEVGGLTMKRLRNVLSSAVGTGISENMIDCYEAIIANYEDNDRIFLFGFSRGAYTARCVANVLNLCGVPSSMPDGKPVPKYGPELRKIASDAVLYVYEHGSGKPRGDFEDQREEKARRFRAKYNSEGEGAQGEKQGNVQPIFIGVFDTVAALGSSAVRWFSLAATAGLAAMVLMSVILNWVWWIAAPIWAAAALALYWSCLVVWRQLKFFKDPSKALPSFHFAAWNLKNYDRFLDNKVRFARHAISIDESRMSFPVVPWGSQADMVLNGQLVPKWLKQIRFAGNHSDIGGSYQESESRLSDIALKWMLEELRETETGVFTDQSKLRTYPLANGIQHDEIVGTRNLWPRWIPQFIRQRLTWSKLTRVIDPQAELHPSVLERVRFANVAQMGETKPYRPENLKDHHSTIEYY
jgi:uncharacterized protein (DUF2235 family)